MRTGSTIELLLLLAKSILGLILELDSSPISMEDSNEENAPLNPMNTQAPRSSDGDFNSSKSKNILKRTKKEMDSKSTHELSPIRAEEHSTESLLKPLRIENDVQPTIIYLTPFIHNILTYLHQQTPSILVMISTIPPIATLISQQ
jgi:hypothetical protein